MGKQPIYFFTKVTPKLTADGFEFTNPGILKLPIDEIFKGGNSKPRNPHMQTMLRMVGFGDNAGSGFPTILHVWNGEGWVKPELNEDARLNQVTLTLKMIESAEKSAEVGTRGIPLVIPLVAIYRPRCPKPLVPGTRSYRNGRN